MARGKDPVAVTKSRKKRTCPLGPFVETRTKKTEEEEVEEEAGERVTDGTFLMREE